MKLADFYARIAPYLLGKIDHDAVVPALWGDSPPARDADRLRIYGRFCQQHRQETIDGLFPACRSVVVAAAGEESWYALIEEYFFAHPMHHFELNRNGEHFAEFLATPGAADLPPFLPALADLEWWDWQTTVAPDEQSDAEPADGALRLHSSVELRPYDYDLITWLDEYPAPERPPAPEPEQTVVVFWRDRELDSRRELASPLELMIIKAVVESVPLSGELAARLAVSPAELAEKVADLQEARILLGRISCR
jgi:hypothetical protein